MCASNTFPGLRRFTPTKIKRRYPVPSDIEIAQEAVLKPIKEVAESVGLSEDDLDYYGKYKAKVHLDVLEKFKDGATFRAFALKYVVSCPVAAVLAGAFHWFSPYWVKEVGEGKDVPYSPTFLHIIPVLLSGPHLEWR